MNLIMAKKNKGPDILIKLLSLALSNTSQFLATLTSIHKVKQMTEGLWVHFFKDVGSWWQMSVNMHYAFNVWKSLLWHWHFGYRIIKGVGQRRHVFISVTVWQKTGIICFSAIFMFLPRCGNFSYVPVVQFFRFVSVHLSSAKPITWGGHHFFSVWEDHNICQLHPLSPLLSVKTESPQQLLEAHHLLLSLSIFSFIFFWGIFTP